MTVCVCAETDGKRRRLVGASLPGSSTQSFTSDEASKQAVYAATLMGLDCICDPRHSPLNNSAIP